MARIRSVGMRGVSIHAPAWGATLRGGLRLGRRHVSIHAPAWGATLNANNHCLIVASFNPRARVGRDDLPNPSVTICGSFNPRARVGRDGLHSCESARVTVSIHAPAWGATSTPIRFRHKPILFQSTRPRGARQSCRICPARGVCVSIHAPAWGATPEGHQGQIQRDSFNPRARVGRDAIVAGCYP